MEVRRPPGDAQDGPSHASAGRLAATPRRARTVALALLRVLVNVAAVLVLYYRLPLHGPFGAATLAELFAGLLFVALLAAWQIRSVLQSPYPVLQAAETLSLLVPLFLVLFAATYQVLAAANPASFSQAMSRTDTLYFVVTVFSTVGFGDITAVSEPARVLVTVQMIGDLVFVGLIIRALMTAMQRGRAAGHGLEPEPADSGNAETPAMPPAKSRGGWT
jgi:voltage-gated potassium channel